jgi:hypothetical protein
MAKNLPDIGAEWQQSTRHAEPSTACVSFSPERASSLKISGPGVGYGQAVVVERDIATTRATCNSE